MQQILNQVKLRSSSSLSWAWPSSAPACFQFFLGYFLKGDGHNWDNNFIPFLHASEHKDQFYAIIYFSYLKKLLWSPPLTTNHKNTLSDVISIKGKHFRWTFVSAIIICYQTNIFNPNWAVWAMKGSWKALFFQGSPETCLTGSILGSMKFQEGPLSPDRVPQWPKMCSKMIGGAK